jgi:predicted DsbA family dithiol-disulfide isomerase
MTTPLRIDIVSDVMCPWYIIGYRQLVQALEATSTEHEIHWHPFELNPDMPAEGQNLREHVTEKYGSTAEQSEQNRQQMTKLGTELGFDFRFTEDMRMHNTFNTHQVLHWAGEQGRKNDLEIALFSAHFTNRRNLSDVAVLAEVAGEVGLYPLEALAGPVPAKLHFRTSDAVSRSKRSETYNIRNECFVEKKQRVTKSVIPFRINSVKTGAKPC